MKRAALIRRSEKSKPWRRKDSDKVSPADYAYVATRDGCVAVSLGAADRCRDNWGTIFDPRRRPDLLEIDHIREAPMVGKRGKSERRWMVGMCPWHHRLGNPPWATGHREAIREYLERVERGEA